MLYTKDGDGKLTSLNLMGLDDNVIATQRKGEGSGAWYLYNKDVRESTSSMINSAGELAAAYEYDEFGETTVRAGESFYNEIGYTGQVYDESTRLYYYKARYYEPETGRFISQDTYRGEQEEPGTWHLYSYCANDPVNYTDPSGHKYDRKAAIDYAENYAYGRNYSYPKFSSGDCANFVSQCLVAGGKEMNKTWYCKRRWTRTGRGFKWSKQWSVAQKHYDYFKGKKSWRRKGKIITIKKKSSVKKYSKKKYRVYKGDLMYFGIKDKGIYHATMINRVKRGKNIFYTAHSGSRFDEPVTDHLDGQYVKIIRIK